MVAVLAALSAGSLRADEVADSPQQDRQEGARLEVEFQAGTLLTLFQSSGAALRDVFAAARAGLKDTGEAPAPRPQIEPAQHANRRDSEGRTPLHLAALEGDLAAARRWLEAGADLEARVPGNGVTPLMMAAFKGHREMVEFLVEQGADVQYTTPQGTSPLHYAAVCGDLASLNCLLAAGAEVDPQKPGGTTPLILAAQHGHGAVVARLAEAGADVNAQLVDRHVTGLMLAAQNGHVRAVAALLRAGADPQRKDRQGRTARDYAQANQRSDVIPLLAHAAETNAAPRKPGD